MVRRFFATTLFITILCTCLPAKASDFTDHFTLAKMPTIVPPFTFQDAKGREMDLKNFKGSFVLLNVWATWCGPCAREMPTLDSLAEKLGGTLPPDKIKPITINMLEVDLPPPFKVIALAEDHDGLNAAQAFYKKHDLKHLPVFVDSAGEAPNVLEIRGLPTTLLIDPEGREIGRIEGEADWDDPATIDFIQTQMKSASK